MIGITSLACGSSFGDFWKVPGFYFFAAVHMSRMIKQLTNEGINFVFGAFGKQFLNAQLFLDLVIVRLHASLNHVNPILILPASPIRIS